MWLRFGHDSRWIALHGKAEVHERLLVLVLFVALSRSGMDMACKGFLGSDFYGQWLLPPRVLLVLAHCAVRASPPTEAALSEWPMLAACVRLAHVHDSRSAVVAFWPLVPLSELLQPPLGCALGFS